MSVAGTMPPEASERQDKENVTYGNCVYNEEDADEGENDVRCMISLALVFVLS